MARKKKIKQKQTIVASDSKYEIHETSEKGRGGTHLWKINSWTKRCAITGTDVMNSLEMKRRWECFSGR